MKVILDTQANRSSEREQLSQFNSASPGYRRYQALARR